MPLIVYIVIFAFCIVIVPNYLTEGMFFDGLTYATISRNLSEGIGHFWQPHYTLTAHAEFYEHPPLMFALQGAMFWVFGDKLFVEALFSGLCLILSLLLIYWILKILGFKSSALLQCWGLTALLFLSFQSVQWGFSNNLLELPMTVFVLAAVALQLIALTHHSGAKRLLFLALGSVAVFLAIMTKGPVGAFPLVVPAIWAITHWQHYHLGIALSAYNFLILFVLFSVLFVLAPEALGFFERYIEQQVLAALSGDRSNISSANGFLEVFSGLSQILPPLLILLLVARFFAEKTQGLLVISADVRLFFLIGLAGSLPMGVSHKVSRFYLIPSLAFFALALGIYLYEHYRWAPRSQKAQRRIRQAKFALAAVSMVVVTVFLFFGDRIYLRDERIITTVNFPQWQSYEAGLLPSCPHRPGWATVAYFARYHKISFRAHTADDQEVFVWTGCDEDFSAVSEREDLGLATRIRTLTPTN